MRACYFEIYASTLTCARRVERDGARGGGVVLRASSARGGGGVGTLKNILGAKRGGRKSNKAAVLPCCPIARVAPARAFPSVMAGDGVSRVRTLHVVVWP